MAEYGPGLDNPPLDIKVKQAERKRLPWERVSVGEAQRINITQHVDPLVVAGDQGQLVTEEQAITPKKGLISKLLSLITRGR